MEITLEKIELVKDRTGVTYKEAKDALEAAGGNVVDAIIGIEEAVDNEGKQNAAKKGEDLIEKMKAIVKKGNVSRIVVKKDDDIILNIPLNAGIIGTVVAPWGMIAGVVAAFGFKCKIEFLKDDGSVLDISDKAAGIYDKAGDVFEEAKEKGGVAYQKAMETANDMKEKFMDKKDDVEVKWEDLKEEAKDASFEKAKETHEATSEAAETVEDIIEEVAGTVSDLDEKLDEIEKEL